LWPARSVFIQAVREVALSELQAAYVRYRASGKHHHETIGLVARDIGVDPGTVSRVLGRASKGPKDRWSDKPNFGFK
jgi:hypothetical protein